MNYKDYEEEVDFKKYAGLIFRSRWVLAVCIFLGAVLAILANILPIHQFQARALVKSALAGSGVLEPASRTAEKIKNGYYGYESILEADNISEDVVIIDAKSLSRAQAEKAASETASKIVAEQNNILEQVKKQKEEKINKIKSAMDSFIARGQPVADFQLEIFKIEEEVFDYKPAELVGTTNIVYKNLAMPVSIALGLIFGLVAGIIFVFLREWVSYNKNILFNKN